MKFFREFRDEQMDFLVPVTNERIGIFVTMPANLDAGATVEDAEEERGRKPPTLVLNARATDGVAVASDEALASNKQRPGHGLKVVRPIAELRGKSIDLLDRSKQGLRLRGLAHGEEQTAVDLLLG